MDLPDWFEECAVKGNKEQYKILIIQKWIMNRIYYDDADTTILKMILKRAWAGKDGKLPGLHLCMLWKDYLSSQYWI